jgi:ABC-2 type transport system ATP-binding protein
MDSIHLESVSKIFRHRPALFNWLGKERRGETRALDEVSLRVPGGSVLALLGPNGSGKTTLLKLISTMLLPDAGRVLVGGNDTAAAGATVRRRVGFAIAKERSFFPRLSARENLDFFAALDDVPRQRRTEKIRALLDETGLSEHADTLVMKFSSGMYQRLGIARALVKQPSVILLDEPTRSLDPGSTEEFWKLVRRFRDRGATVVVATHNFEEAAALGDSLVVLQEGRLVDHRNQGHAGTRQLRSWYLNVTGGLDAVPMAAGGWQ